MEKLKTDPKVNSNFNDEFYSIEGVEPEERE
jgi:hypothetical protein